MAKCNQPDEGGGVRRVRARAKAAIENVVTPEAEAKNRVERIMRGEDPFALWDALAERIWERKRKLLPRLKLTYPSDDESRHIAQLARVNDASSFGHHIRSIILDAHLNHASFLTLSIPQVKKALKRVSSQANRLGRMLSKLDVGSGSKGSYERAGWLIQLELSALQQFKVGGMVLLPEYIDLLDALSSAAQRAAQKPMHPPKGAGGNPAFDIFIQNLLMAVRMRGGRWSNYRSIDGIWEGTLLEALGILEKYLPQGFLPPGEIGRSVEHIRKKLNDHIRKAS